MLQIEEHETLVALYRTVIEGKFAEDPDDPLVARSPYAAEACRRVLAALDPPEKHGLVATLSAPFDVTTELREKLVAAGDAHHAG